MPSAPCPRCDAATVARPVPPALRETLAGDPSRARLCGTCLHVAPAPDAAVDASWNPADTSGALPAEPDAALAVGILVTLLDSLALNRREIEDVVAYLEEEAGVDPLLAIDRLGTAPLLDPAIDLARRRQQLAQIVAD